MLARVDEADVACWGRGSEREELAEGGYRCVGGDGQGDGFVCMLAFCVMCSLSLDDVLSPDNNLTKIWKFSIDEDEDVDVEEAFDEEREVRMLGATRSEAMDR